MRGEGTEAAGSSNCEPVWKRSPNRCSLSLGGVVALFPLAFASITRRGLSPWCVTSRKCLVQEPSERHPSGASRQCRPNESAWWQDQSLLRLPSASLTTVRVSSSPFPDRCVSTTDSKLVPALWPLRRGAQPSLDTDAQRPFFSVCKGFSLPCKPAPSCSGASRLAAGASLPLPSANSFLRCQRHFAALR